MARNSGLTVTPGSVLRIYSEEEAATFAKAWITTFGKAFPDLKRESFLWHVFSGGFYPCEEGEAATKLYRSQLGSEFIVLDNDRKHALLTDQLPEKVSPADSYVFPADFAWTMAFTHEIGWLGPYFACHPNPAALERANKAAAQKAKEAETARRNGWA